MAEGNFGGGTGIENDPYLVEDVADLLAVGNMMAEYYLQANDINLSDYGSWTALSGPPYGLLTGGYDGGNYKIIGLKVKDYCRCHKNPERNKGLIKKINFV